MSSLALYRRYRPETFAEVIGQEHVTVPLQQALRNNRVNHAYLFSGPRGCGKTTSARILARCLNCERGPTPTPCGECQSCVDLARNGPGSIDVIEIDAASHGGVDDARELREKAFFGPAVSRFKIYIIDEAHMVTPAGFNALLKVVEEPPEHLKFIFATTEPEKVIGTIRSRTHHYPFRLVPPGTLREYLGEVCQREEIPVDPTVLPLVVRAGAGSVRDSMSVMDQLLAGAADDGVTYEMATSLLGYTDGALLDDVVDAFKAGDGSTAFGVVDRVIEGGHDPRRFVTDLLERLRDLLILAAVPDAADKGLIDVPADVLERMRAQATAFGPAELSRAADLVNTGLTEMRGATSPRLQLELICARVLLPAAYGDERALQSRLDRLERGGGPAAAAGAVFPPGPARPGRGTGPAVPQEAAQAQRPPAPPPPAPEPPAHVAPS
ncbi:DNA polymerase III subunit gamma and tau, partial [Streptomyces mayteni]